MDRRALHQSTDDAYAGGNVTAISPHVAGFVSRILVGDNRHVRAGQLLVSLDRRDFAAALQHAEAVAEQRAAALAGLRAKYALQQSMIAQIGAYAASGAYLLTVIPAHGLWIDANFKEDQLAHMRPGQPATVVADVLPGKVFRGHVQSLAPGTGAIFSVLPPENATGNFTKIVQRVPVRIALDDGAARLGALRPGLSMTVSVDTRRGAFGAE